VTSDNEGSEAKRLSMIGAGLMGAGDIQEAILRFNEAIESDPTLAGPYINRGAAYHHIGNLDQAQSDFERALEMEMDPEQAAAAHSNLGLVFKDREDNERAMKEYDMAIQLNPKLAQAYMNRATIHTRKGDEDAAMVDVGKAIELEPSFLDRDIPPD